MDWLIYFHKICRHSSTILNEFTKECYRSAVDCQSEVILFIHLCLLKLDTNDFDMFILSKFTEFLGRQEEQGFKLYNYINILIYDWIIKSIKV